MDVCAEDATVAEPVHPYLVILSTGAQPYPYPAPLSLSLSLSLPHPYPHPHLIILSAGAHRNTPLEYRPSRL